MALRGSKMRTQNGSLEGNQRLKPANLWWLYFDPCTFQKDCPSLASCAISCSTCRKQSLATGCLLARKTWSRRCVAKVSVGVCSLFRPGVVLSKGRPCLQHLDITGSWMMIDQIDKPQRFVGRMAPQNLKDPPKLGPPLFMNQRSTLTLLDFQWFTLSAFHLTKILYLLKP